MNTFEISTVNIDSELVKRSMAHGSCGAFVSFEGWARDHNDKGPAVKLEYQAYDELAINEGTRILAEAVKKFGVVRAVCIHRVGVLHVGDMAVWIGVSAGHRGEAFDACRYIIDQVKLRVPIWKKEYDGSGDSGWVNCATGMPDFD